MTEIGHTMETAPMEIKKKLSNSRRIKRNSEGFGFLERKLVKMRTLF